MRYFHTLADSTIKRLRRKHVTWGEIMKRYKQPEWCGYPDALQGCMGCWSLVGLLGTRHLISEEYCKKCDCFIEVDTEP